MACATIGRRKRTTTVARMWRRAWVGGLELPAWVGQKQPPRACHKARRSRHGRPSAAPSRANRCTSGLLQAEQRQRHKGISPYQSCATHAHAHAVASARTRSRSRSRSRMWMWMGMWHVHVHARKWESAAAHPMPSASRRGGSVAARSSVASPRAAQLP
eukprot:3780677-Prymnesium_polylepis.1